MGVGFFGAGFPFGGGFAAFFPGFFGIGGFGSAFFATGFFGAAFFGPAFFGAGALGAGFLGAGFLGIGFFGTGFFFGGGLTALFPGFLTLGSFTGIPRSERESSTREKCRLSE